MRTYSNFILFEDTLDNIPDTSPIISSLAKDILNPVVQIVEDDCKTTLGKVIETNFESQGYIELATGQPITKTRLETLLGQGRYTVSIRDTFSCTSEGGLCKKCYSGTFVDKPAVSVGDLVKIVNRYVVDSQIIAGDGTTTEYPLGVDPWAFTTYSVYPFVQHSIDLQRRLIKIVNPIPLNQGSVFRFYKESLKPYFGYLAKSYSGSLMGIKALQTSNPSIKLSHIKSLIGEADFVTLSEELNDLSTPSNMLQYYDSTSDPLEKLLFGLLLYAVYSNVQ